MDQSELFRSIVRGKFVMHDYISADAQSFIDGLLNRHVHKRLGTIGNGIDDFMDHPWLSLIDHDRLLLKEIKAPVVPDIADELDASNFDDWSSTKDKTLIEYPPLSEKRQLIFENF
jgi:serine/threonine protein kinase